MVSVVMASLMLASACAAFPAVAPQTAEALPCEQAAVLELPEGEKDARLWTQFEFGIRVDDTDVIAYVKNKFTFLPSVVHARVALYASETYTEDLDEMEMKCVSVAPDLDMGHEITAWAPHETTMYWRAEMNYYDDDGVYQTRETGTYLIDANGNIL